MLLKKKSLILPLVSLGFFAVLAIGAANGYWTALDGQVANLVTGGRTPALTQIMVFLTTIGNPIPLSILAIILALVFKYTGRWPYLLFLIIALTGGLALEILLKILFHLPRPDNGLIEVTGYSFPSGHATMALIFFSVIIYSLQEYTRNSGTRYILTFFIGILSVLIGLSRVYLGVHWFSDVLAGFSLGLFWFALVAAVLGEKLKNTG